MDENKLYEKLGNFFDNLKAKDIKEFAAQLQHASESMRKTTSVSNTMRRVLEGNRGSYEDLTDQIDDLNKAIKEEEQAIKKLREQGNKKEAADRDIELLQRKREADKQKRNAVWNASLANTSTLFGNLAIDIGSLADLYVKASEEYVQGLQSGREGTQLYAQATLKAAEASGKLASSIGEIITAISGIAELALMLMPAGKVVKGLRWLAGAAGIAGVALDTLGNKAVEHAKTAIDILSTEIENTKKGFRNLVSTGAEFAGGMTEMRQIAAGLGLDMTQLGDVAKHTEIYLASMGYGIAEGLKYLTGVTKRLKESGFDQELYNLGYSFQDQIDLMALTSSSLQASGRLRIMTDQQVAEETLSYGKSLKILSDLTSKDAKKALEKSIEESEKTAVYGVLMREGGPKAVEAFQGALAAMPEKLQKGFIEFIASHGRFIRDAGTNLAMQMNKEILPVFQDSRKMILSGAYDTAQATKFQLSENEKMGAAQLRISRDNTRVGSIALSAQLGAANQVVADAVNIIDDLLKVGIHQQKGATKLATGQTEGAARTADKLTQTITAIDTAVQNERIYVMGQMTGLITSFSSAMNLPAQAAQTLANKFLDIANQLNVLTTKPVNKPGSAGPGIGASGAGATGAIGDFFAKLNNQSFTSMFKSFGQSFSDWWTASPAQAQYPVTPGTLPPQILPPNTNIKPGAGDGAISPVLQSKLSALQTIFPGSTIKITALNDSNNPNAPASHKNPNDPHYQGRAVDFTISDYNAKLSDAYVSALKNIGFKNIIDEYKNPSKNATGGHIHAEVSDMANGGIVSPAPGGRLVRAGEAGQAEGIFPFDKNRPVPMKLDDQQFAQLVRVLTNHADISKKILQVQQ